MRACRPLKGSGPAVRGLPSTCAALDWVRAVSSLQFRVLSAIQSGCLRTLFQKPSPARLLLLAMLRVQSRICCSYSVRSRARANQSGWRRRTSARISVHSENASGISFAHLRDVWMCKMRFRSATSWSPRVSYTTDGATTIANPRRAAAVESAVADEGRCLSFASANARHRFVSSKTRGESSFCFNERCIPLALIGDNVFHSDGPTLRPIWKKEG